MGQVYGNSNVFFGITSNFNQDKIIAWTFSGVPYYWIKNEQEWEIKGLFTGHFKNVTDVRWANEG